VNERVTPANTVGASPVRGGAVAFIFITLLLDMFALGLIMPILPKLVESFVANDTASAARIASALLVLALLIAVCTLSRRAAGPSS